jgi:hypothetical protein
MPLSKYYPGGCLTNTEVWIAGDEVGIRSKGRLNTGYKHYRYTSQHGVPRKWGMCYKLEGRGIETRWGGWILLIYLILPAALGPGDLLSL